MSWTIMLICAASGCASSNPPTTQPLTASQQQDKILADPMGYKPSVGREITGGDVSHFDHSGFNKDLNDVLNP